MKLISCGPEYSCNIIVGNMWNNITLFDYLIASGILLAALYIYFTWTFDFFSKRNVKFRKPVPLFGNGLALVTRRKSFTDFMAEFYNEFKDYDIFGLFQFMNPAYFIRDPELLKLIMVKDFDHFMDHVQMLSDDVDPLFSANLISLKGEKWKQMKGILSPAFTVSKMKVMFPLILKCGQQLVNHLESLSKISASDGLIEIEMKDLFTRYTNDVIATVGFGICCDSLKDPENEFYLCGKDITSFPLINFLKMIGFLTVPKLMTMLKVNILSKKSSRFLYNTVHETIQAREKGGIVRPDMIHLLMQARREEKKGSDKDITDETTKKFDITDTDITAQVMIFFLEGFEMPSTVLSFASLLLATHPDIQERLREEIDQTLEDCEGNLTYDHLNNMKYLDMVISETLRLYPPSIATERQCCKPYTIPPTRNTPAVKLNTKDRVFIPIYAIHHDPKYYPEPEKFDPERFNEDNKRNIKPYTYLPFGAGPRSCIGNLNTKDIGGSRFALMENKIALVYLLSRFTLQTTNKTPNSITYKTRSFTLEPDKGFWVGLRSRKSLI